MVLVTMVGIWLLQSNDCVFWILWNWQWDWEWGILGSVMRYLFLFPDFFKGHGELVEEEGNMEYLVWDDLKLKFTTSMRCHFSSAYLLDRKGVEIKKRSRVTLWIKDFLKLEARTFHLYFSNTDFLKNLTFQTLKKINLKKINLSILSVVKCKYLRKLHHCWYLVK